MCVGKHTHITAWSWRSVGNLRKLVLSTMWVLGIKPKSSSLVASTFTHGGISTCPETDLLIKDMGAYYITICCNARFVYPEE